MGDKAGAPAERHPVEPPHLRRHREIDEEKDQHRGQIGEQVNGEAPRTFVDENAFAAVRLAQEKRQRMRGDRGAPAHQHPDEPGISRRVPEIDRGQRGGEDHVGREVGKKDAHRQIFEHGPGLISSVASL
jgi:hypothetical protein